MLKVRQKVFNAGYGPQLLHESERNRRRPIVHERGRKRASDAVLERGGNLFYRLAFEKRTHFIGIVRRAKCREELRFDAADEPLTIYENAVAVEDDESHDSSGHAANSPIAALFKTLSPSIAHFMRVALMPIPTFSSTASLGSVATS